GTDRRQRPGAQVGIAARERRGRATRGDEELAVGTLDGAREEVALERDLAARRAAREAERDEPHARDGHDGAPIAERRRARGLATERSPPALLARSVEEGDRPGILFDHEQPERRDG